MHINNNISRTYLSSISHDLERPQFSFIFFARRGMSSSSINFYLYQSTLFDYPVRDASCRRRLTSIHINPLCTATLSVAVLAGGDSLACFHPPPPWRQSTLSTLSCQKKETARRNQKVKGVNGERHGPNCCCGISSIFVEMLSIWDGEKHTCSSPCLFTTIQPRVVVSNSHILKC